MESGSCRKVKKVEKRAISSEGQEYRTFKEQMFSAQIT